MESITAVARIKYQDHEVHISVRDEYPLPCWEYRGPGGTYHLEVTVNDAQVDYEIWRLNADGTWRFPPRGNIPGWDAARELAIKYAAGVQEWGK